MNRLTKIFRSLIGGSLETAESAAVRHYRVLNLTQGTVLATSLEVAGESSTRTRGLLGRDSLAEGEGLWIIPCEGVHTIGMRFPIDLVYINGQKRVRKVRSGVPPWRLSFCLTARSVLELPAGTIRETQTQRGDQLEIALAVEDGDQA